MTKHRVDKATEVDDLMNRVREHWDEVDAKQGAPTTDTIEKQQRPTKLHGPSHRGVNLADAYDFNLVASQFATVEAFGRQRKKRPVVKSETAAGLRARLPPNTTFGQAGLAPPTKAGQKGVPQWVRQELAYEEAIALIEERARKAAHGSAARSQSPATPQPATVKKAPPQPAAASAQVAPQKAVGHVGTSDNRPDTFDGGQVEVTDPNFVYKPGESFFESLAAGAQIVSGEGAEFIDPEATQTQVAFGRPLR